MPRHPGRVERGGGASGRRSPALAGALPYPRHLPDEDGRGGQDGGQPEALPGCPVGGRVRVCGWRWWGGRSSGREERREERGGRGGQEVAPLLVAGEVVAMAWTVKTADRAEGKRGTGEDVGGILCPGSSCSSSLRFLSFHSLSFFVPLRSCFFLPFPFPYI